VLGGGQPGPGTGGHVSGRQPDQLAVGTDAQLAPQRGGVALHGAHRDEQPGRDLDVAEVLAEQGEDLGLTARHPRLGEG
jgi:hypothetical protein